MPQFGSTRFGWDSPSRIAGTTMMLTESGSLLPGEPMYAPLVPFYPSGVPATGVIEGATGVAPPWVEENGLQIWQVHPARCDLILWQGDDVIVTMYFRDSENPALDMSDTAGFSWTGQIKVSRDYTSDLVAEMPCVATYFPTTATTTASTKVEMLLPRESNTLAGCFTWELHSVNTADLSRFPQPTTISIWPPTTFLRTWMFGRCFILSRVGETDFLVDTEVTPPVTPGGYAMVPFVGPNGRVP